MTLLEWLDLPTKRRPEAWCPVHPQAPGRNGGHAGCGRPCVVVEVTTEGGGKELTLTARNAMGFAYAAGQRWGGYPQTYHQARRVSRPTISGHLAVPTPRLLRLPPLSHRSVLGGKRDAQGRANPISEAACTS